MLAVDFSNYHLKKEKRKKKRKKKKKVPFLEFLMKNLKEKSACRMLIIGLFSDGCTTLSGALVHIEQFC